MRSTIINVGAALGGLCAVGLPAGAFAQDRGVVFGGAEGGEDASAYVGATLAASNARLGEGWAVRAILSTGAYDYDGGANAVEAEFVQGDLAVVRQMSGAWGYFNLGAGARVTDTDLDPDDSGNAREGRHWDAIVSADGARDAGAWRMAGFGVYGVRMREYYVRADVTRRVSSTLRLGVEALADGDESFDRTRIGALATYEPAGRYAVRAVVGARDDGGAYVSLGLTRTF